MADLMYAAVLEKLIGEQFDEQFEFDGIIPEDTTVTQRTVTAVRADGVDVTNSIIISSSISSTIVTVTLNTRLVDTSYIIKVQVVASDLTPAVQSKLLNVTEPGIYR